MNLPRLSQRSSPLFVSALLFMSVAVVAGCGESLSGPERGSAAGEWHAQAAPGELALPFSMSVTLSESAAGSLSGSGVFHGDGRGPLELHVAHGWNDNFQVSFTYIVGGVHISPRYFRGILALDGRSIAGTIDDRSVVLVR